VLALLGKGANINAPNKEGETALRRASLFGHLDMVQVLLDRGADVNASNKYGGTALTMAEWKGFHEVSALLVAAGANNRRAIIMSLVGATISILIAVFLAVIALGAIVATFSHDTGPLTGRYVSGGTVYQTRPLSVPVAILGGAGAVCGIGFFGLMIFNLISLSRLRKKNSTRSSNRPL
jgi:hypothetical protein